MKVYKRTELLQAIINDETMIKRRINVIDDKGKIIVPNVVVEDIYLSLFVKYNFELIEEEETKIDIQDLVEFKEVDEYDVLNAKNIAKEINCIIIRQNTILEWAKQQEKKLSKFNHLYEALNYDP